MLACLLDQLPKEACQNYSRGGYILVFAFEERGVPLLLVFVTCNLFVLIWSYSFCRISTDLLLDIQWGNTGQY